MKRLAALFFLICFSIPLVKAQNEWRVWVKTSPCSGRYDWISVAKNNPSGGGNIFVLANQVFGSNTGCTNFACTYSEAISVANALRPSDKFLNYKCPGFSSGDDQPINNNNAIAPGDGYKVWIKTAPCSGRFDWVTVAKDNPAYGGGGGSWLIANLLVNPDKMMCLSLNSSCTLAEAQAEAAIVRTSPIFSNYCCKDYNVWQNNQTGKYTIVLGSGSAGFGWRWVKGPMCCEDAEAFAGIPGACSGKTQKDGCYPGSHAVYDKKHNTKQCYCNEGLYWNEAKTACVTIQELEKEAKCYYPGSYAKWDPQTKKVLCYCPEGKQWNADRSACIDINNNEPKTNNGNRCPQEYESVLSQMLGSWKGNYMIATITGTCDNVTGTFKYRDWGNPLDDNSYPESQIVNATFTGSMGRNDNDNGRIVLKIHYKIVGTKTVKGGVVVADGKFVLNSDGTLNPPLNLSGDHLRRQ